MDQRNCRGNTVLAGKRGEQRQGSEGTLQPPSLSQGWPSHRRPALLLPAPLQGWAQPAEHRQALCSSWDSQQGSIASAGSSRVLSELSGCPGWLTGVPAEGEGMAQIPYRGSKTPQVALDRTSARQVNPLSMPWGDSGQVESCAQALSEILLSLGQEHPKPQPCPCRHSCCSNTQLAAMGECRDSSDAIPAVQETSS